MFQGVDSTVAVDSLGLTGVARTTTGSVAAVSSSGLNLLDFSGSPTISYDFTTGAGSLGGPFRNIVLRDVVSAGGTLDVTVTNSFGQVSSFSTAIGAGTTPQDIALSPQIGLSNLDTISFVWTGDAFGDAFLASSLDAVAVPEPATCSVLALGFSSAGLVGWRRRSKKRKSAA